MPRVVFPNARGLARCAALLDRWHTPRGLRRLCVPALVGSAFLAAALIVYTTGGTKFAHAHLFYVPILLSAFCFGLPGGIAGGLLAGLFAGPFMPLDVAAGVPQSAPNWLARAGYFTLIGALAGGLCRLLSAQIRTIRRYGYFDPLTGLPNKTALRAELGRLIADQGAEPLVLIRLQILGFEDINAAFGYRTADTLLQVLAERLTRVLPPGCTAYHLYAAHFGILCRAGPERREAAAVTCDLMTCLQEPALVEQIPISVEGRLGVSPATPSTPQSPMRFCGPRASPCTTPRRARGRRARTTRPSTGSKGTR